MASKDRWARELCGPSFNQGIQHNGLYRYLVLWVKCRLFAVNAYIAFLEEKSDAVSTTTSRYYTCTTPIYRRHLNCTTMFISIIISNKYSIRPYLLFYIFKHCTQYQKRLKASEVNLLSTCLLVNHWHMHTKAGATRRRGWLQQCVCERLLNQMDLNSGPTSLLSWHSTIVQVANNTRLKKMCKHIDTA